MKKLFTSLYGYIAVGIIVSVFPAMMAGEQINKPMLRMPHISKERHHKPRQMWLFNDVARECLGVDEVHAGVKRIDEIIPFTGKGVVIGMTDCGIDPRHPAFTDPATGKSRVGMYLTTTSEVESESGEFEYKAFYPMEATPAKRDVDFSCNGHGTHTSATAAGANIGNPYYGMASDATLVLTSIGDYIYEDEMEFGITSALDYARENNMPCVVSLSIGSCAGMHDGSGYMTTLLSEELDETGQIVCFAAGNDGNSQVSLHRDFSENPVPLRTALAHGNWGAVSKGGTVYLVSKKEDLRIAFTLLRIDAESSEEIWMSDYFDTTELTEDGTDVLPDLANVSAHLDLANESSINLRKVYGDNGNVGIEMAASLPWLKEESKYALGFVLDAPSGGDVYGFADLTAQFHSFGVEGYIKGKPDESISDYATCPYVISVGATNERESYTDLTGQQQSVDTESYGNCHGTAKFSSYGSIPEKLPHTTGPGVEVISALQDKSNYTKVYKYTDKQGKNWFYGTSTGTSMSTPAIAGVIALWLQAKPDLTRDDILNLLQLSGTPDYAADRSKYGVPSAYKGLKYILENMSGIGNTFAEDSDRYPTLLMMKYLSDSLLECVVPFPTTGGEYYMISADGIIRESGMFDGQSFNIDLSAYSGVMTIRVTTPQGYASQKVINQHI